MEQQLKQVAEILYRAADVLAEIELKSNEQTAATPQSDYLTIEQTAKYLGLKKSVIYQLTHRCEIPYTRPTGRQIYFHVKDLQEWQSRNRKKSIYEIESEQAKKQS